ncbi:MAG TPA: ABC transporter ATP-binding protein, partial [Solirubrobacteraceae bacterium]|nr:ABC transporter ATP-binding protein [Solirubrobacteraceae bacterium]
GERVAVSDVSFTLGAGEVLAIIGPNGAGKTTLLSMLAGGLAPTAGSLRVPPAGGIGWVPQQNAVYSKLSVAENLRLFARLEGVRDTAAAVAAMLAQTGLEARAGDEVGSLSGGNRQRVNIAVGLIADPAVLLLDEPSAALDPRQRARLWEFINARVAGGTSVVFATHDIAEAERYAGRLLVLADGEMLFSGPPAELNAAEHENDLERAFVHFLAERGH